MIETDYDLIVRYLRDEEDAAIRELFGRYEENLFGYLWKILRHQQDSEDALQDTFRKTLAALPNYQEKNHFKSWLFRIGHNTAIDLIHRRRKVLQFDEDGSDNLENKDAGPRDALIARERAKEIREAVEGLPELEREVVALRMQADLSFKEIAEVVDAPLGTVLARMHKAKQRLKPQLTKLKSSE